MPHLPATTDHTALFEICHRIPGRMRLRVPALQTDPSLHRGLETALRGLTGVRAVRANPACASFVLYHRTVQPLSPDEIGLALQPLIRTAASPSSARPTLGKAIRKPRRQPALTRRLGTQDSARMPRRLPKTECRLCQLKLIAARWILADVWRCWRQGLTQRMRTALITAITPLR